MSSLLTLLRNKSARGFPSSVEGMILWSDTELSPIVRDTNGISRFDDLSGNGFHFLQSDSTRRPSYLSNQLNGKSIVRFNGTSQRMATSQTALFDNLAEYDIFIVARVIDTVDFARFLTSEDSINIIRLALNSSIPRGLRIATTNTVGSPSVNEVTSTVGSWHSYGIRYQNFGTGLSLFVDGTLIGSSGNPAGANITTNAAPQTLMLGARSTSGSSFGQFDMAALIAYRRALSSSQRTSMDSYLKQRYNLP